MNENEISRAIRLCDWTKNLAARVYGAVARSEAVLRYVRQERDLREWRRKTVAIVPESSRTYLKRG